MNNEKTKVIGVLDFDGISIGDKAADFVTQKYMGQEFEAEVLKHYQELGGEIGENLEERMNRLMGLRELGGIDYGIRTGFMDEDTLSKIRNTIINPSF